MIEAVREVVVDELAEALDGLAGADLSPLSGPALLDRLRGLLAAQNRLAAEIARTVRQCELAGAAGSDGLKTMQSWLPITTDQRRAAAGVQLVETDATLARVATEQPLAALVEAVQRYLASLEPDGPEPDPPEGRSVVLAQHPDGSLSGRVELDAVGGEKPQAALEAIVPAGRCAGDIRGRARQLGDALLQLCDNALASGALPVLRTVKPHVVLTLPAADLAGTDTGPDAGELGSGAVISAARARGIACDATLARPVPDPDGLPLDVGRTARVVPPHLRRAVEHRDRCCVFTGCGAPTYWCHVPHLLELINGGQASLDDPALLCERHHTKVHHGFRVERQPDGRWRTWRPDGTEILIHPPLVTAA